MQIYTPGNVKAASKFGRDQEASPKVFSDLASVWPLVLLLAHACPIKWLLLLFMCFGALGYLVLQFATVNQKKLQVYCSIEVAETVA